MSQFKGITKINPIEKVTSTKFHIFGKMDVKKNDERTTFKGLDKNSNRIRVPYYYGFLGLVGLGIGLIFATLIILIPQDEKYSENPEYWYKNALYSICVGFGMAINFGLVQPAVWFNMRLFRSWKPFISRCLIIIVCLFVTNALCYFVWTIWMKQNYPMPLNDFVCATISHFIMQGTLWFHLPAGYDRKTKRKTFCYFLLSQLYISFCFWEYLCMGYVLSNICSDYQWILAIIFALIRELNQGILSRICGRISTGNEQWIRISAWHYMAAVNAFYLTVAISSVATNATSFLILAIDFSLNIYISLQIIWKFRKNNHQMDDEIELLLNELVMNEKLEAVIPIGYGITYLMAYYGPNKHILGDIENLSVEKTIRMTGLLFLLDSSSMVLSALLIWFLCKINLFHVYLSSQKETWLIIASHEAYLLCEVTLKNFF